MKVIGLTGGIASGKSAITKFIEEKGIPVIDGDKVARDVVQPGSMGLEKIKEVFGEEYISPEGSLNRKKLGELVFNHPERIKELNGALHPLIRGEFQRRIDFFKKDSEVSLVLLDAALLIESEMLDLTDSLWLVYADKETQIKRVGERDGMTRESAMSIINSQMPLEEKKKFADEIIDNNGELTEAYKIVERLLKKYMQ